VCYDHGSWFDCNEILHKFAHQIPMSLCPSFYLTAEWIFMKSEFGEC
jgi:hypothetical protein